MKACGGQTCYEVMEGSQWHSLVPSSTCLLSPCEAKPAKTCEGQRNRQIEDHGTSQQRKHQQSELNRSNNYTRICDSYISLSLLHVVSLLHDVLAEEQCKKSLTCACLIFLCIATSNRCIASSNKCIATRNKKLLGNKKLLVTRASLLVTSALLVVTRSF